MHYLGGKYRIAGEIVKYLPDGAYVEPFVGGASVLCRVINRPRFASDANAALIALWKALQSGYSPPEDISEDEYAAAKNLPDDDPRKAFIGFGCSFSGKWFGGYARCTRGRNYARDARNSLLKKISHLADVQFSTCTYQNANYPAACVVYCDPPYAGTTQYGGVAPFSWVDFWSFYRDLSLSGRAVFVSEYTAPEGWEPVMVKETRTELRTKANGREIRIEKLFTYKI
jgi:DNA adenine methylase